MSKSIYDRIIRYVRRGFTFLEPRGFDKSLYANILRNTHSEERRQETKEIMDIDGELKIVTITYQQRQWPLPNTDSYQLQEGFIEQVRSQQFN